MTAKSPLDAAKSLIRAEFDACRKPRAADISERSGVSQAAAGVLIDEIRHEREQAALRSRYAAPKPPEAKPNDTGKAPVTHFPGGVHWVDPDWLKHPSLRVRHAAEAAVTAVKAAALAAKAESEVTQLAAKREQLMAELQQVDARLKAMGVTRPDRTPCDVCGVMVGATDQARVVHARRSGKHQAAVGRSQEVAA
jgi:hypothetical protein